jgi:hypothetical protein
VAVAPLENEKKKRLVSDLSPRKPGFDPRSVHVRLVVDKVALGQVFLRVRPFSPVSVIPPMLHTDSVICYRRYTRIILELVQCR